MLFILGGFKLILSQIIGQGKLLIFLILGWGTNKDLPNEPGPRRRSSSYHPVAPVSLYLAERLEMLLPLRSVSNYRSEACS
jgi:hypothetical protein